MVMIDECCRRTKAYLIIHAFCLVGILLSVWLLLGFFQEAFATTIYSYVDERGTAVMTDNYNSIPERYRSKVKINESSPSSRPTGSPMANLHSSVTLLSKDLLKGMTGLMPDIPGMTSYQSQILIYAGLMALVCVMAMYLSRGQVTRFLALWCLVLLGLATPVLLYVSKDGPVDVLRGKAGEIQEKQQDRLKNAQ
ncbi:MAG TPA: DUF4124 domain-containing protein [Nitrospiraceae bacterium]